MQNVEGYRERIRCKSIKNNNYEMKKNKIVVCMYVCSIFIDQVFLHERYTYIGE